MVRMFLQSEKNNRGNIEGKKAVNKLVDLFFI